jgi:CheY-like chemotaxis protein
LYLTPRAFIYYSFSFRYVFHEVRVPLNTIQLGLESVMGDVMGLTEDIDDVLESVGEAVSTMSETLDDVLSYQKIEDGHMEVNAHVFDLAALLDQCSTAFAVPCRSKRLRLTISTDGDVPNLPVGDALRVRQVLNNFISNAIKFTARGGSIHICVRTIEAPSEASPHDHLPPLPSAASSSSSSSSSSTDSTEDDSPCVWLEFSVTDSGCGIAADNMRSLFSPFTQIRAGDLQMGRGSGLGLCICKHIIHLFKGRIGVRSSPGSGSCFFFALPFGTTYAPNDATARSARLQSSLAVGSQQEVLRQPSAAAGAARVLVVDDVSANRRMLKRCVEQLGFQVDIAEDGAEAVQMWQAAYVSSSSSSSSSSTSTFSCGPGYMLVLMDNLMPNMTGCDAARKIRELEEEFESSSGSGSGSSNRNSKKRGKKSSRSRSQEDTKRRTLIIGVTGNALSIDLDEFIEAGCDEVSMHDRAYRFYTSFLHAACCIYC